MSETKERESFSAEEVARHSTPGDTWIILYGKVYDVSKFTDHPGSLEALQSRAGTDRTARYEAVGHPPRAKQLMQNFYVGELREEGFATQIQHGFTAAAVVVAAFFLYRNLVANKG